MSTIGGPRLSTIPPTFFNDYSFEFDGVDDYVSTNSKIIGSDITLSGWVNFNGSYSNFSAHFPMSITPSNIGLPNETLGRFYKDGSKLQIAIQCNDNTGANFSTYYVDNTTLEGAGWQHICLTYNATTGHIYAYLNGVTQNWVKIFAASTPIPFLTAVSGRIYESNLTIGRLNPTTSTGTFLGLVDEVSTYNRILTQAEITSIASAPTDLTDLSPVAWYRMGDNGVFRDPQWLIPNNENKDKASNYSMSFDGTNDYMSTSVSSLNSTTTFTISFWGKKTSTTKTVGLNDKVTGTNKFLLYWWSDGNVYLGARNGASNSSATFALSYDSNWHHFMGVYVGGTSLRLYVDGVLRDTITSSVPATLSSVMGNNITIGYVDNTSYTTGSIDEVAIWNSDQSTNAADIYNLGTPTDLTSLSPLAYYKMGEDATFRDPQWLLPSNENKDNYSNYSLSFDGINDYINCGNVNPSGAFTASLWVKRNSTAVTELYQSLIVKNDNASERVFLARIYIFDTTRAYIQFYISDTGVFEAAHQVQSNNIGTALNDLDWHHICLVNPGDGELLKIYMDGSETFYSIIPARGTGLSSLYNAPTTPMTIGGRTTGGEFNGKIDEVAIFDGDQSANISTIYNSGKPTNITGITGLTNHWRIGEDATFDGTNWTVPDIVGSNPGTSANMGINDRVGESPSSSGNILSYNMDIKDRVGYAPNSENNALSIDMVLSGRTTDVPT